jgi:hypothetical protein
MARKRLLTILAAAVAAIGLQVGSATALDVDADLEVVKVEASVSEEGIDAKVGDKDEDDKLEAKVSKDGADLKVDDEKVSTSDKAEDVEEAAPEDVDADDGDSSEKGETSSSKETASGNDGASGDTREVTAAGAADAEPVDDGNDHERPDALDPERARQLLPGSGPQLDPAGSRDDITPSFDLSGREDFDAPVVAAPPERSEGSDSADWESVEPPVTERSDAELAAIPAPADGGAVPAGLKLLAGLLVAGTGTLWHLTRRELGTPNAVRTS